VFFLLVTDRSERVMPTIVSRCQVVEFRPLGDDRVAGHLREAFALDARTAEALARLAQGAVERAGRFAEDARGPGRRGEYLRHGAAVVGLARGAGDPDPAAAFVGVLERHHQHIRTDAKAGLDQRVAGLEQQFQDRRDLAWQVERAEKRSRREEDRARRVAALDAVDVLGSWLRDLWVVACGASDVLWNCDRGDEIAAAAVAAPEHYARLLAEVGRTRKDLYLNIDQKLALYAMFARFEEVAESA
jgi:DNA polymerase-3 subunit delta'